MNWLVRVAEHNHAIPVVCGNPELARRVIGGMGLHVVSIEAWPTDDRLFPCAMSIDADRIRLAQMARERLSGETWVAPTSPRYTPPRPGIRPIEPQRRPRKRKTHTSAKPEPSIAPAKEIPPIVKLSLDIPDIVPVIPVTESCDVGPSASSHTLCRELVYRERFYMAYPSMQAGRSRRYEGFRR